MLFIMISMCLMSSFNVEASNYINGCVSIDKDWGHKKIESSKGFYSNFASDSGDAVRLYKVTDAGRLLGVVVDVTDFGLSQEGLYRGAYRTIVVIFQITMKEIDDGYQEIYLINTDETAKGNLVKPITKFEHGSGYKDTSFKRYEFYAEFTGTALCSTQFSICFSANGLFSDDWLVGNVEVQLCTSFETKKNDSLMYVKNANVDSLWK